MSGTLKIGELAHAAGISTDAVRYYERLSILPRPSRTRSGYRLYSEVDIERLRFIRQAQSLGLSLNDIKELLPGRGSGRSECGRVKDLLSAKLSELDAKIAQMRDFRKRLGFYLEQCEEALAGKQGDCCPVLFESSPSDRQKATQAGHRSNKVGLRQE